MKLLIVDDQGDNSRLDKYLCKSLDISFAIAQKIIRQKKVKINQILAQNSAIKIVKGEKIEIASDLKSRRQKSKKPVSAKLKSQFFDSIIYQDQDIVAINKPSGIATQGGSKITSSIDDVVKSQNWQLVHRLDKETSGCLIIAKNPKIAELLTDKFRNKEIKKTYLALVHGNLKKSSGTISIPLIKKHDGKTEKVFADNDQGKEAITKYKILKSFKDTALLELTPLTGRTHQIRVHLKEIGHPIINDIKYGGAKVKNPKLSSLCLHSSKIEFSNQEAKKIIIKASLPSFANV